MSIQLIKNFQNKYKDDVFDGLDGIFVGTMTPAMTFPSTASMIVKELNIS